MHYIKKDLPFELYEINLKDANNDELVDISRETSVGLSLEEMLRVKDYFHKFKRNPTDIEFQAIGQAWSEHCCYKSSKPILKEFVFGIDAPQNILVIKEDAGIVDFDEEHAYVVALESHNHPSAIGPYGGSATGIGGIVRDVVCMGAQPIAFIDPLFFGPLDYPYDKVPKGVKHPKYIFSGVVSGIRDYGNRLGIPTTTGMIFFDEGFVGNCLVNVGCVGIVKKEHIIRSRVKKAGNIFVYCGGKTGRDGIHGVTFASAELTEESEDISAGAVQLGDPITKEPLIHACLEANEKGLLDGMKDLGGGGLSCVVGEMALAKGLGAEIELEKVPLKEEGLKSWEIWVSESQERMMLAVDEKNLDEVLSIFRRWDVIAIPIGKVIEEKILKIQYHGKKIFELDLEFLTDAPAYCRPYKVKKIQRDLEEVFHDEPNDYNQILLNLLSSQNIANKEWVIRQYDHEVRANTVIKPLQGKIGYYTHGDSSVIKPLEDSNKGIALTSDVNPGFVELSPFDGSCSAIDEVCRNLVAVGARPHSFADCLNFGNPEKEERLGDFYESARGLGYVAKSLGVPFVSGNVSFYNETKDGPIPPTPTILGVGLIEDITKCVTVDFKETGNTIYLVGVTKNELGGSEYYKLQKIRNGIVPKVDVNILKNSIEAVLESIDKELIASCHDVSDGGIGVCISEMCIGGNIGAEIDVSKISNLRSDLKIFSESNTRWIVEITRGNENEFEKIMKNLNLNKIGKVCGERLIINDDSKNIIDLKIDKIKETWDNTFWKLMG